LLDIVVMPRCLNCLYRFLLSQRNISSSSVNGNIAFLWDWPKFDPPQYPNP